MQDKDGARARPDTGRAKIIALAALILLVAICSWPQIRSGALDGHDMSFHAARTVQQLHNWQYGCPLPQVNLPDYHGRIVGGGINIFYPPISAWIMAGCAGLLTIFGAGIEEALLHGLALANVLVIALCAASMFYCCKRIFNSFYIAILCAALYVSSPYFLADFYVRGAVGESAGMIFLPILTLGIYSTFYKDGRYGYCLAPGGSGIALSNLPMVNTVAIFLALFCIWNWRKLANPKIMGFVAANILLALAMTAFFWVPFVYEAIHNDLVFPYYSVYSLNITGLTLKQLFSPWGNTALIMVNFSIPMIFWAIICPLFNRETLKSPGLALAFVLSVLLTLKVVYDPDYAPWAVALIEKICRYQFPWRNLVISILLGSLLAGVNAGRLSRRPATLAAAALLTVICCCASSYFYVRGFDKSIRPDNILRQPFLAMDYAPKKMLAFEDQRFAWDKYSCTVNLPQKYKFQDEPRKNDVEVLAGAATIASPERNGCGMSFSVEAGSAGASLELPFVDYTGYEAGLIAKNGEKSRLQRAEAPNGLLAFAVPPGASGRVEVAYVDPWWRKALNPLALAALACVAFSALRARRPRP